MTPCQICRISFISFGLNVAYQLYSSPIQCILQSEGEGGHSPFETQPSDQMPDQPGIPTTQQS